MASTSQRHNVSAAVARSAIPSSNRLHAVETSVIAMPGSRIPLVVETEGPATSQPIGLVELSASGTTQRRTRDFLPWNGRGAQMIAASSPERCQPGMRNEQGTLAIQFATELGSTSWNNAG